MIVAYGLNGVFQEFDDCCTLAPDLDGSEKWLSEKGFVVELFAWGLDERWGLEIEFAVCKGDGDEIRHVAKCSGEGVFRERRVVIVFGYVEVVDFGGLVTDVVGFFDVEEEKAFDEMARDNDGGNEIVTLDVLVCGTETMLAIYHLVHKNWLVIFIEGSTWAIDKHDGDDKTLD